MSTEAQQFDRLHVLIHHKANQLMDLCQAGQLEAATAEFGPLQTISDDMVRLLQAMEAKLQPNV